MHPIEANGRRYVALRDRLDPTASPVVVSREALFLLDLIDGTRTIAGLRAALALRAGIQISEKSIHDFVQRLDRAGLLDSEAYQRKLERLRDEFGSSPARAAIHAGAAYPAEPQALRPYLDSFYSHPDGPGVPSPESRVPSPRSRRLLGLVAPHVDLHRGGPTYAWAYRALAEAPTSDLYIVLGTRHTPMATPFAATAKPYATPFGPVQTDHAFLEALSARCEWDLFADEFSHCAEHSVEFQAVYLRDLQPQPRMVALLCNALQFLVPAGEPPSSQKSVADLVNGLRELASSYPGTVCFIAGADLAHVGPQFGDPSPVTPQALSRVGERDMEMLELALGRDADGFYQQVISDQDARRICGLTPIYVLGSLMAGSEARLLKCTQWASPDGYGSVSFASLAFWER